MSAVSVGDFLSVFEDFSYNTEIEDTGELGLWIRARDMHYVHINVLYNASSKSEKATLDAIYILAIVIPLGNNELAHDLANNINFKHLITKFNNKGHFSFAMHTDKDGEIKAIAHSPKSALGRLTKSKQDIKDEIQLISEVTSEFMKQLITLAGYQAGTSLDALPLQAKAYHFYNTVPSLRKKRTHTRIEQKPAQPMYVGPLYGAKPSGKVFALILVGFILIILIAYISTIV